MQEALALLGDTEHQVRARPGRHRVRAILAPGDSGMHRRGSDRLALATGDEEATNVALFAWSVWGRSCSRTARRREAVMRPLSASAQGTGCKRASGTSGALLVGVT
jgi:hypothetical protein